MKLIDFLSAWDGVSHLYLKKIYSSISSDKQFTASLIRAIERKELESGVSWLLKHHLSSGHRLTPAQEEKLVGMLPHLSDTDCKLHVLQCMQYLSISKQHCDTYAGFVSECLAADNKFVRAWAYSGLYELAVRHPAYRKEAKASLALATKDPAASVRARARAVLKKGFG